MRFKDQIKGLDPKVFELAAEKLFMRESVSGACRAIDDAKSELETPDYGGYHSRHHRFMDAMFKPEYTFTAFWFGPTIKDGIKAGKKDALKHRVQSLLLLAEMIRYARR